MYVLAVPRAVHTSDTVIVTVTVAITALPHGALYSTYIL